MVREQVDLLVISANELLTMRLANARNSDSTGVMEFPRTREQMRELGIIRDGAVASKNGKITIIGKTDDVFESVEVDEGTRILDASGKTVMPGFVDPHTHLIFSGSREGELALKLQGVSYMEILRRGGGILSTVRATRAADKVTLVAEALQRLDLMLVHGTTTVEAKSGYGLTVEDELKSLEVMRILQKEHAVDLVPTFLGAHAVPPEYSNKPGEYIDLIISEMLPEVARGKLAEFCDVFCEEGVFSVVDARRLLKAAKNCGLKVKLHADEMVRLGGAELSAELGAISADHLLKSSEAGITAMAEGGVIGVLLPATPFALMQEEYANARAIIDAGVPVALATDLNPNCWVESMQFIIALACYKMRMEPAEALVASTINAAHAVGRGAEFGSLEIGKKCDLIILDVPNHLHVPYHFGVNLVDKVVKNGRLVVDNGKIMV